MALSALGRKHLLEYGRQATIARRYRVSRQYVTAVVNGDNRPKTRKGWERYSRIQQAVADELGMTKQEAFSAAERGEENIESARQALVA